MLLIAGGLEIVAKTFWFVLGWGIIAVSSIPTWSVAAFWYFLGYRAGDDDPGSRYRHLLSAMAVILIGLFILEAASAFSGVKAEALTVNTVRILIFLSFVYFTFVVVVPALFIRDSSFDLNARRLIRDILLSAAYAIFVFALLYRQQGILPGASEMVTRDVFDTIYFSAVTFSTLGFGDFRPAPSVRGYAAVQGLWGNIHLGLLAGAVFYAIQNRGLKKAPVICDVCERETKKQDVPKI